MSKKVIEVQGRTYEANVIDLSVDELNSLLSAHANGDVWVGNEELEEQLLGDSVINGYLLDQNGPHFELEVDGVVVSLAQPSSNLSSDVPPTMVIGASQLVLEKWSSNASSTFEISGEFQSDLLVFMTEALALPTGDKRVVTTPYYAGDLFDFQGSSTDQERIYILNQDGKILYL
jgi:hypothetical protein